MTRPIVYVLPVVLILLIAGGWLIWLQFDAGSSADESLGTHVTLEPKDAAPSPGPPTTLRLVLQLSGNEINAVSAMPRRGAVAEPEIGRAQLLAGKSLVVAYRGLDSAGQQVLDGVVVIPLTARVEYQDPEVESQLQSAEERLDQSVVTVSIPYRAGMAALEFSRLEPDADADVAQWNPILMNVVDLPQDDEKPTDGEP